MLSPLDAAAVEAAVKDALAAIADADGLAALKEARIAHTGDKAPLTLANRAIGGLAPAEKAVAGKTAVKRNRFVKLSGGTKSVNRDLEAKSRALAGFKAYITNMLDPDPDTVIGAYHQLWRIEQSFRMSKSDLQARPIYHRKRASIEAHLAVVFAALAITRYIEDRTGMSIKKFVQTTRRFRTVQINVGGEILTAEDPLPPELRDALAQIG